MKNRFQSKFLFSLIAFLFHVFSWCFARGNICFIELYQLFTYISFELRILFRVDLMKIVCWCWNLWIFHTKCVQYIDNSFDGIFNICNSMTVIFFHIYIQMLNTIWNANAKNQVSTKQFSIIWNRTHLLFGISLKKWFINTA